jgi:hypothetical protein
MASGRKVIHITPWEIKSWSVTLMDGTVINHEDVHNLTIYSTGATTTLGTNWNGKCPWIEHDDNKMRKQKSQEKKLMNAYYRRQ